MSLSQDEGANFEYCVYKPRPTNPTHSVFKGALWSFLVSKSYVYIQCYSQKLIVLILQVLHISFLPNKTFAKQFKSCIVYIFAVFLFPAFVEALLHLQVHYRHLQITGIMWNHWKECVSGHLLIKKKQKTKPHHRATRGQRLHRVPFYLNYQNKHQHKGAVRCAIMAMQSKEPEIWSLLNGLTRCDGVVRNKQRPLGLYEYCTFELLAYKSMPDNTFVLKACDKNWLS